MLNAVNRSEVSPAGCQWLDYYTGLEHYVLGIYRTENAFQRAKKEYGAGNLDAARSTMVTCRPEEVIEQYAKFSQHGGMTRGEEGLVVSMNTRWLPHYVRFRQMLGQEAVRYDYAPTSHDLLAQSRGVFTFYFGPEKSVWQCLGKEETKADVFVLPPEVKIENASQVTPAIAEVCRTGIESSDPVTVAVRPILSRGSRKGLKPEPVVAGSYQLMLLMLDPSASAAGERVFEVQISATGKEPTARFGRSSKWTCTALQAAPIESPSCPGQFN